MSDDRDTPPTTCCPLPAAGLTPVQRRRMVLVDWLSGVVAVALLIAGLLAADSTPEAIGLAVLVLAGREGSRLLAARWIVGKRE